MFRRVLAMVLCAAIAWLCPGVYAYGAASQAFFPGRSSARLAVKVKLAVPLQASKAVANLGQPGVMASLAPSEVRLAPQIEAKPTRPAVEQEIRQLGEGIRQVTQGVPDLSRAEVSQVHEAGGRIMDVVLGARPVSSDAGLVPGEGGMNWAKPAGDDIRKAAEAQYRSEGHGDQVPAPHISPNEGRDSDHNEGRGFNPLAPRILGSVLPLIQGTLLVPAMLAGSPVMMGMGVLAALGSVAVAAMPWLKPNSPKWLRQAPGHAVFALGMVTLVSGIGLTTGTLATLGGWALVDYLGENRAAKTHSFDHPAYVAAYVGALGMVAGTGIGLGGLYGTWPSRLTIAAGLTSPALLWHLPPHFWAGVGTVAKWYKKSLDSFMASQGYFAKDSRFQDNLMHYSRYLLRKSSWHFLWLGPLVLIPYAAIRAADMALMTALPTVVTALRAAPLFLWGASYVRKAKGWVRFWAGYCRSVYRHAEGARGNILDFKVWISALLPIMSEADENTRRPTWRAAGAVALALVLQLAWGSVALVSSRLGFIWGSIDGLREFLRKSDPKKPDPDDPGKGL